MVDGQNEKFYSDMEAKGWLVEDGMEAVAVIVSQCPQYIHHILTVCGEALL